MGATKSRSALNRAQKWPLAQSPGADEVDGCSGDGDEGSNEESAECVAAVEQDENESGNGGKRGQRVERDLEGAIELGALHAEQHDASLLKKELQKDAGDDEHGDDLREREETEERSDETEGNQRTMWNAVPGMDGAKIAEVVAVTRGGVRYARVAELERED